VILKAAAIQLRAGTDMARNLKDCSELVLAARDADAQFVATPEMTNILEPDRVRLRSLVGPENADKSVAGYAELARRLGIWLNIGSLALKGNGEKLVNRSLLYSPEGRIVARYDKIHLFDVELPSGDIIRESEAYDGGERGALVTTGWSKLGLTICYDVRFPSLYRALAKEGAEIITVPSAFTVPTGEVHWHVLLQARAIETGCFVIAAAQGGRHESGRETYGHSLIVSPWGKVIADAGSDPGIILAELDLDEVRQARCRIPALNHERAFALKAEALVAT
jgi:deaminated glutathione amidase